MIPGILAGQISAPGAGPPPSPGAFVLTAETGAFALIGQDAGMAVTVAAPSGGWTFSTSKTNTGPGASSITFTGYAIGAAAAGRVVVAAIAWSHSVSSTLTGVTIGGVAATPVQTVTAHSTSGRIALYYAVVPTGTTADVAITISTGISSGIACHVWYGFPATSTPLDSGSATATGGGIVTVSDLQIAAGGILIAFAGGSNSSDPWTFGWNGADTLVDQGHGTTNLTGWSVRHALTTVATTTNDLTSDPSGTSPTALIGATWGA